MAKRRYHTWFPRIRRQPYLQWKLQGGGGSSMMAGLGTLQADTRNGVFANEGWGGGVFNYNTAFGGVDGSPSGVGGLGADDPRYPWRQFSADTQTLQVELNKELTNLGLCPLLMDGVLGPRTCGAVERMGMFDWPQISTCTSAPEAMILPHEPPCVGDAPAPSPAPPPEIEPEPEPEPEPLPPEPKTGGMSSGLVIAGVLLLAGTGAAIAMSGKKRR